MCVVKKALDSGTTTDNRSSFAPTNAATKKQSKSSFFLRSNKANLFEKPCFRGRAYRAHFANRKALCSISGRRRRISRPDSTHFALIATFRGSLVRWKGFTLGLLGSARFFYSSITEINFFQTASLFFFPSSPINFILLSRKWNGRRLTSTRPIRLILLKKWGGASFGIAALPLRRRLWSWQSRLSVPGVQK